jgi:arylformamidase
MTSFSMGRHGCPCEAHDARPAQLYDISPPLNPHLAVWPGDPPFARELTSDPAKDGITSSMLRMTAHLGAHVDAPSHVNRAANAIDRVSLDTYLGPCQVIHVDVPRGGRVTPDLIDEPVLVSRVLLATGTRPNPQQWNDDFAGASVELVDALQKQGVVLLGIDTPSVDRYADSDLPVHHRLGSANIAILEGLVLDDVPAGVYELIALPLRIEGGDGSPVRAVLRTISLP